MDESIFVVQADTIHNLAVELRKLKERVKHAHSDWIITAISACQVENGIREASNLAIVNFEKRQ